MRNIYVTSGILLTAILFGNLPSNSFGHGEDKAGPHGGFVRMPGGFHTEVLRRSDTSFDVYLLDVEWKNPTVEGSSVNASLIRGKKKIELQCAPEVDRFSCKIPSGEKSRKKDRLDVTAVRNGVTGGIATYPLPLKLEKIKDHSNH